MAVVDQADGSARLSCSCSSRGSVETTTQGHDELSRSNSFWTPAESPSSSPPSSINSSRDSIAVPDLDRRSSSSSSSTSFYESFYEHDHSSSFDDFEPAATLPPAVQTMMAAQGKPAAGAAAGHEYDPKRLPSSMFRREQSTFPAQWSAASNESLFSIQLENSGEVGPLYGVGDLYYDAAGAFHRLSSAASARLPAVRETSPGNSGGLSNEKSVRFAAAADVSGPCSLPAASEEAEVTETGAAAAEAGWCFWPSATWWPSCACRGCGCDCRCS